MFSRLPGLRDYEFIYVCNSTHISEQLLKEAKRCSQIYGLDMTLVILGGYGGFGAANNVAAEYANSDRVIIMNPDVFPYDSGWAEKHSRLLDELPAEQTDLFGEPLYYDDGSLMHAGMYFCADTAPSFVKGAESRGEHFACGTLW